VGCILALVNVTETLLRRLHDPLTVYRGKTGYVAGEFGAALLVISIAMAIYFLEATR
jgi:hypothetical protein